jgi:mRNA-degrading endonuclease toxin of MazEF toxin-antitoxin module
MARSPGGRPRSHLIEQGDIFSVSLDPTQGREQQGFRPVLVVSPTAFNQVTGVPIVAPITGGGSFARTAGFAVPLSGAGTDTTGVIRCDQLRVLDLQQRKARKVERAPDFIVDEVLQRIAAIFEGA